MFVEKLQDRWRMNGGEKDSAVFMVAVVLYIETGNKKKCAKIDM